MMNETISEDTVFRIAFGIESSDLRAEYLRQVGIHAPDVRDRVQALLTASCEDPDFLEVPASGRCETVEVLSHVEPVGAQVGHYKIREQLAEGGMGVVYVAEQTKPVRRKVALKLVKPGMGSKEVVARFEAERQALAMMDHANIARVFDGGATDAGQPYFAMELVQGLPITHYCDEHRLTTSERLKLFNDVCRAVQHAHQKGVIHRDLKPSNVVVAEVDSRAVPKVIDFGVAKAVSERLTEETIYTHFSQMVGTPLYMSPEQTGLGVVDIDTRSDVYSLGVLLYELLTGQTPFDLAELKRASFDEMRRVIREDEPPRPSVRWSTLSDEAQTTLAASRCSDVRQLCDSLRGELDWIVMKALEKDRSRRYDSASALAEDIERHLRDEPIEARPASRWYRTQKFVRRNRAMVLSLTAVIAALSLGAALATVGLLHALNQRDLSRRAEEDARDAKKSAEQRSEDLAAALEGQRVLTNVLRELNPTTFLRNAPGRTRTVYESIEAITRQIEEENSLSGHPRVEIDVRTIIAEFYFSIGEYDRCRDNLEKALTLAKQELGDSLDVAGIHRQLAYLGSFGADRLHDPIRTVEHADEAIRIYESKGKVPDSRIYVGKAYSLQYWPERHADAIAAAKKAVKLGAENPTYALADLGNIYMLMGDDESLQQAIRCFDAALVNYRKTDNPQDHIQANFLSKKARCHRLRAASSRFDSAVELERARKDYQEAYGLFEKPDLRSEPEGHRFGLALADLHFATGSVDDAFKILGDVEANAREFNVASSLILSRDLRGWLYFQLGDFEAAEPLLLYAKEQARAEYGVMHSRFGRPCFQLALMYEAGGQREQAEKQYSELQPLTQHFIDEPQVDALAYWVHARGILATHDDDALRANDGALLNEAERIANEGHENVKAWRQPNEEAAFYLVKAIIQQVRHPDKIDLAVEQLKAGLTKAPEPSATLRNERGNIVPTDRWQLETKLAELLVKAKRFEEAHDFMMNGVEVRSDEDVFGRDHIQTILAEIRLGAFRQEHGFHTPDTAKELEDTYEDLRTFSPVVDGVRQQLAQLLFDVYTKLGIADEAETWRSTLKH